MTGLVIKAPWIDLILAGKKSWELRGSATKMRGRIALIKSKSGTIVGECDIVDCVGPFTVDELRKTFERHQVPDSRLEQIAYEKTYAWVLGNVREAKPPIRYQHPSGAVIWVRLTPENCSEYVRLGKSCSPMKATPETAASKERSVNVTPSVAAKATAKPARLTKSAAIASQPAPAASDLCMSFWIELADGAVVVPCRVRDRATGQYGFKVTSYGNTNEEAVVVTDEAELRQYVGGLGYRVRCKSRDEKRSGLFTSRAPNRLLSK